MMTIGPRHNAGVSATTKSFVRAAGDDAIVLPQGSVRLGSHSEPEPDLVLLRPRADFYASRLAGPEDILLVVEIADSSFEYDRDVKGPLYAQFGVPEYWLADLNANEVWRFLSPEGGVYRQQERYVPGQILVPSLFPACRVDAAMLMPE
jgi:Uma2 family endonuclease